MVQPLKKSFSQNVNVIFAITKQKEQVKHPLMSFQHECFCYIISTKHFFFLFVFKCL